MLPVVAGVDNTRRQIFLYSLPMAAAAVAPWPLGLTGWIYGVAAIVLNFVFLVLARAVAANRATDPSEMEPEKHLFAYSVFYLFALFTVLVVDRWLPDEPEDEIIRSGSASGRGSWPCCSARSSCCCSSSPRQDGDELVTAIAQKNARTALIMMALIVAAMLGLAFASVPLYRSSAR